jgi:hypothetical protein
VSFPDLDAAYLDLCEGLPRLVAELVEEGHDPGRCAFEVTDAEGRPLMEVPLLERLRARAARPPAQPEPEAQLPQRAAPRPVTDAWDEACRSRSAEALARSYALLRLPVAYPWLRYRTAPPGGSA